MGVPPLVYVARKMSKLPALTSDPRPKFAVPENRPAIATLPPGTSATLAALPA
jgi:hypothetical protein